MVSLRRLLARVSWIWGLIIWTLFLWLSRLRNVMTNDELSSTGRAVRVGVVVVFVALAGLAVVAARRRRLSRAGGSARGPQRMLIVFVAWTVGYWLIRGVGILIDGEYSVGFKAVHTVLMVVSLTLSALTARQLQRGR